MTLILTLRTDKAVVQVSDRRLTWTDGRIKDDEANKAICVYCHGGRFSLAYTGLAEINRQRTDLWLCDLLREIDVRNLGLPSAMAQIKQGIETGLQKSRFHPYSRTLIIVCAGYEYHPTAGSRLNRSFVFPISVPDSPSKIVYSDRQQILLAHGQVSAITDSLLRRIKNLGKKRFFVNRSEGLIAKELVSLIRAAATTPKHGFTVGRSCMSVIMTARDGVFGAGYHPRQSVTEHYMPHIFMSNGISIQNVRFGPVVTPQAK